MKWLRRRLERKDLPAVIVSVSEIQPKRLAESGEGYLHLHMMWLNSPSPKKGWTVRVENLKAWVADWLIRNNLWEENSHVNVDTRSVKGEKSRYLAKYASKGSDEIAEFAGDCGWESVPSQWWNITNKARQWVKANLIEGRAAGELLDALVNQSFDAGVFAHFHYLYHVDIEVNGRRINVGWRGGLQRECYDELVDMLSSA
jgi:hypothetical protein